MINNVIHIISFTPKIYQVPYLLQNKFLITEDEFNVTTEDGEKIRL
jgi:hypothetical protein